MKIYIATTALALLLSVPLEIYAQAPSMNINVEVAMIQWDSAYTPIPELRAQTTNPTNSQTLSLPPYGGGPFQFTFNAQQLGEITFFAINHNPYPGMTLMCTPPVSDVTPGTTFGVAIDWIKKTCVVTKQTKVNQQK